MKLLETDEVNILFTYSAFRGNVERAIHGVCNLSLNLTTIVTVNILLCKNARTGLVRPYLGDLGHC